MTTYLITRHQGAIRWIEEEGLKIDQQRISLDPNIIQKGDIVIGTLPINLAAEVCHRGGRYLHLTLTLTPELRGKELTASQMRDCDAHLSEYQIKMISQERST